MDTTPIFIKMADCPEIQELKPVEPEGFIYNPNWNKHEFYFYKDSEKSSTIKEIWLPRQDDLQKMLGDFAQCQDLMHVYLSNRVGCPESELWDTPPVSMEQLWLAFMMKEKHNKAWNGEVWVSE